MVLMVFVFSKKFKREIMHTHIIYYVTHNDTIIYIGSGLPNRYKHTESGVSHVV